MMNKKFSLLIPFGIALLMLNSCNNEATQTSSSVTVSVRVSNAEKGVMEELETVTGTVCSKKEVVLSSELEGKYVLLNNPNTGKLYRLGDKVKKGAEIIKLINKEYENDIQLDYKKLEIESCKKEYESQKNLFDKGGVTESELIDAEGALLTAQYNYETAQINIAKMTIIAPFDGVIVELPYNTPNVKIDDGEELVAIMDYSDLYLTFNLPEKSITSVKVDQEVYVQNYTIPDDTLMGAVTQLSPAIDEDTRTFGGIIEVENTELKLRPGMFIQGDIVTERHDDVFLLSKDIVTSSSKGDYVYVAEKGIVVQRRIKTGLENDDYVEVTDGIKGDELIVTEGYETLRDRSKIKILK